MKALNYKVTIVLLSSVFSVYGQVVYCQPDFDKVIGEKIVNASIFKHPGIDHIDVLKLDYFFESLPTVSYDVKKASFVPEDVVLENYKFPNCTSTKQEVTENFKLQIALKKQVTVTKSDFTSNKFSFGFKVPIYAVEVSMSDEVVNTSTISQSSTAEQTITKEFTRNTPFQVPANKVTFIQVFAKRGTIRVPFQASFKVNGTVVLRFWLKGAGGILTHSRGYVLNIQDILNDHDRTFNFNGYVTNDNSSDLTVSYAERPIDSTDCIGQKENIVNNTKQQETEMASLESLKNKMILADDKIKAIKLDTVEAGLKFKTLRTIPNKLRK